MKTSEKAYYSLDIETSGFDPEKNEILEVGFVRFKVSGSRFKVEEKWTKVFKPKGQVNAHILGLTGISQKELDDGEDFEEHRKFLQKKLGNEIIVGHNIVFDIRFLEKNGIKFFGQTIDTLDLVQIFLPTHHSYNLENLMHHFGIKHKKAHRALADAQAVISLLKQLVKIYKKLPGRAQAEIRKLFRKVNLPWEELFQASEKFPSPCVIPSASEKSLKFGNEILRPSDALGAQSLPRAERGDDAKEEKFALSDKTIYTLKPFEDQLAAIENIIKSTKEELLIVVPKRHQVMKLWKQGLARGLFAPRLMVDDEKLSALSNKNELSADEAKFLMKIFVWQATNWQSQCIADLNLSFFGGQFKEAVCGREPQEFTDRVLCCDQQTFLELEKQSPSEGRGLIIVGMGEFERAITSGLGQKASWGYLLHSLKNIYDPETGIGDLKMKEVVVKALADVDLFFGITNALLKNFNRGWGNIKIDENLINSGEYAKVAQAANHSCAKLQEANILLKSSGLAETVSHLTEFFSQQPNYIKWIYVSEFKCSLHSIPLRIDQIVGDCFSAAAKVCFLENVSDERVRQFFSQRLGVGGFQIADFALGSPQGLFGKLKRKLKSGSQVKHQIAFQSPGSGQLEQLFKKSSLPAVLVMEGSVQIAAFYKASYKNLSGKAFLLVQQADGGSNKLFRNFSIRKNSLLVVTANSMLKFLRTSQQVRPVDRLVAKTLVFSDLAINRPEDPYAQALAGQCQNPELEYYLPRFLYDLQSVLEFFHTPKLQEIFLLYQNKAFKYKEIIDSYLKFVLKN